MSAPIVEEVTEEESSEEYVLELVPDEDDEEDVFELGEPVDAPAEVQEPDLRKPTTLSASCLISVSILTFFCHRMTLQV